MNNILLVGCGHMGSALLDAWYRKTTFNISVIDPITYNNFYKKYNNRVSFYKSFESLNNMQKFNIVIFAIKPQVAKEVIIKYNEFSSKKNFIISIVAGKKINFFEKYLAKSHQIVRAMPNMPAFVEKGMTCFIPNKITTKKNIIIAKNLFNKVGKSICLKKELDIDKITAISGSGPAYFFLFIDNLISESIKLGIHSKIAKALVYQTAIGSIDLLIKGKSSALNLKNKIAVKGGTTEAAINTFEKDLKFKKIIKKAIKAAYIRSIELGKK